MYKVFLVAVSFFGAMTGFIVSQSVLNSNIKTEKVYIDKYDTVYIDKQDTLFLPIPNSNEWVLDRCDSSFFYRYGEVSKHIDLRYTKIIGGK